MKKKNLPTLIAIAALSWILVNISHETIGHAGFGLLSGFKLNAVNTTTAYLNVNWDNEINLNGFTKYRLFLIGGVFMNFLTGLIAYLILKYKSGLNNQMRLFLWLFASFSYVIIVMNLISVPIYWWWRLSGNYQDLRQSGTCKNDSLNCWFRVYDYWLPSSAK